MEKIAIICGGAAGMMTSIFAASMKKMKRPERSCISQERAGVI